VLQQAQLRGEIDIDDPALTARQFVAMLRGDLHLDILFGLRRCPNATEIHARVASVVEVLLNGTFTANATAEGLPDPEVSAFPQSRSTYSV
jgi:hypothetical protein